MEEAAKEVVKILLVIDELGWEKTPVIGVYHRKEYQLMFFPKDDEYILNLFDSEGLCATFTVRKRKVRIMEQLVRDWAK